MPLKLAQISIKGLYTKNSLMILSGLYKLSIGDIFWWYNFYAALDINSFVFYEIDVFENENKYGFDVIKDLIEFELENCLNKTGFIKGDYYFEQNIADFFTVIDEDNKIIKKTFDKNINILERKLYKLDYNLKNYSIKKSSC